MKVFLDGCRRIETLSAEIYQRLAVDADYAPEVRSTFHRLSNDERSHAREIDLLLQATAQELAAAVKIPLSEIEVAVQAAENIVRVLDRMRLNEEEALQLAVQMEEQFVKVHAGNAVHFSNPRIAALFETLSRHDQEHLDALRQCLAWWHAEHKARR